MAKFGIVIAIVGIVVAIVSWILPDPRGSRVGRIAIITLFIGLGYAALTVVFPDPWGRTDTNNDVQSVEISFPHKQDQPPLPDSITVEGRSSGLAQGEVIWVAHSPIGDRKTWYLPGGPCIIRNGKEWNCPAMIVGKPVDSGTFEIIALVANGDAQNELIGHVREAACTKNAITMQNIPRGARIADSVMITRR